MQDQNQKKDTTTKSNDTPALSKASQSDFIRKIVDKIKSSENILVALSRDPSVDEIAAAIGLTVYLDSIQKHVTAIYSGRTPDAVSFLQPDDTFEKTTDSLRDFIVALDKNKADHLRYKLEGDFVKVFITPYKTKITEEDLSYSYGDYNVDFVIAINVATASNLDAALREYGRIMHDASVVNITINQPGRFGEIEWSDQSSSSLCEMITELVFALQGSDEQPLEHDVATALLTGIVAATDRFSNERTSPNTLGIASKLMSMGADQQLITSNVNGNEIVHNEELPTPSLNPYAQPEDRRNNLTVNHDEPGTYGGTDKDSMTNLAARMAPTVNMSDNPEPTGVSNDINNVSPESVVVQPIIPNAQASPTAGSSMQPVTNVLTQPSVEQMQIPNSINSAAATPAAMNPQSSSVMNLPGVPAAAPNNIEANQAATTPPVASTPNAANIVSNPASPAQPGSANENTMTLPGVSDVEVPENNPEIKNPSPANNSARPMAAAPTPQEQKQVGNTIQPPAPAKQEPKNYAEMLEAALSEGFSEQNGPANTVMGAPIDSRPAEPIKTAPAAEPVAKPGSAVLPPPPAPNAGNGMMPPVLPTVQVPSEMPK